MGWLTDILIGLATVTAATAAVVGTVVVVSLICDYIDAPEIQKQTRQVAKQKCPDALYARIKSKDTRKVKCDIFGEAENKLGEVNMEARNGVDPDLRVGQVIPLEEY